MSYEIFQEGPAVYIPVLIVSLLITVIAYGAIPVIIAKTRKSRISKKSYRWMCFGWNILVMVLFTALGSSGTAYILWTWVFSEWGIKTLDKRGVLGEKPVENADMQWKPGQVAECMDCGYQGDIGNACPKCGCQRRRYVYPESLTNEISAEEAPPAVHNEDPCTAEPVASPRPEVTEAVSAEEKVEESIPESITKTPEEPVDAIPVKEAAKKASPALIAAMVVMIIALAAAMVALVIGGMDKTAVAAPDADNPTYPTYSDGELVEGALEATVPEGNADPSSPSCKGSYTVSDEEVLNAKDIVVATAGEHELTLGQLQIYYWQEVSGFLNQYGAYATYYGLNVALPLDSQSCPVMEGLTWQQYFLYSAINSWHSYLSLDIAAEEAGFQLPEDYAQHVATIPQQLEEQAAAGGYESAQAMLAYNVGAGPTVEDYAEFMEIYYHGYSYFNDFYSNVTATQEEIEAMFAEHEEEYAQMGLTKDTKTVNVRHILIYPEGATTETIRTEVFSEEAWAAGKAAAEAVLQEWLDGEATEESFAALAEVHSQDGGSAANGGLYTDVTEGMMVQNFNDWCFDPARQVGDYEIVETEFGYHIMFYSGDTLQWITSSEADVISQKTNDMVDAALAKNPLTVYYDRILLSMAEAFKLS